MVNEDLREVLTKYSLERLFEVCVENKISLPALLAFEEEDFSVLTSFVGEKVLLRKLVRENNVPQPSTGSYTNSSSLDSSIRFPDTGASTSRSSNSSGLVTNSSGCDINNSSNCDTSSSAQSVPGTSAAKRRSTTSRAASKLQRFDEFKLISDLDLAALIRGDEIGKHIINGYISSYELFKQAEEDNEESDVTEPLLSESQRAKIVEIIVEFLLEISKNPDHTLFPLITKKIVEIFVCEDEKDYYRPPSRPEKRIHPGGRIPNRIRNEKYRSNLLKDFGPQFSASSLSTSANSLPQNPNRQKILDTAVTDDMREAARWLANGRSPWPLVLDKWKLTSPIRFRGLFLSEEENYINTYLDQWPILGHKSGHELILEDFNLLHPNDSNKLLSNWDPFVQKTVKISQRDVKDKVGKALLAEAKSVNPCTANQNQLAILVLRLFPYIRPNHFFMDEGKQIKSSIQSTTASYLLILQNECDLKEYLKKRKETTSDTPGWGQPFIIVVLSKGKFNSVHLVIGTLRFKLEGVVEAIDVFFKSFHSLHINYPGACSHILSMLQHSLYGFSSPWDKDVNYSWIKSVKC